MIESTYKLAAVVSWGNLYIAAQREDLKPEDLSTKGCVTLAATVLEEQAAELAHAARRYANCPTNENLKQLKRIREWYESDWFDALSCGLADGKTVAKGIIKNALRGVKVKG